MKMTMPKFTRFFTAWSFSRLQGWRQCPRRAALKHLAKLPDPSGPAAERGNVIHKAAEVYLLAKRTPKVIPADLKLLRKTLVQLRVARAVAEAQWTFTSRWLATRWDDWAEAWVRMKVDAHHVDKRANGVVVVDWKSGRMKPEEHQEQGRLYAVGGLLEYPNAAHVDVYFGYTDHGKVSPRERYSRAMLLSLQRYWEEQAAPLLADRRFVPRPGAYCSYCPYSQSKGGPCQY